MELWQRQSPFTCLSASQLTASLPHLNIPIIITKAILLQPLVHIMMGVVFKAVAFTNQLLFRHEFMGCGIQVLFQHPPVMFQDQIDLADLGPLLSLDLVTIGILTARVAEFLIGSTPDRGAAGKAGSKDRLNSGHHGSFCAGAKLGGLSKRFEKKSGGSGYGDNGDDPPISALKRIDPVKMPLSPRGRATFASRPKGDYSPLN
jgi:hypothetical protein